MWGGIKKNTSNTGSRWHSSGFLLEAKLFSLSFFRSLSLVSLEFVFLFIFTFPYLIYSTDFPKCARDGRLCVCELHVDLCPVQYRNLHSMLKLTVKPTQIGEKKNHCDFIMVCWCHTAKTEGGPMQIKSDKTFSTPSPVIRPKLNLKSAALHFSTENSFTIYLSFSVCESVLLDKNVDGSRFTLLALMFVYYS